MDNFVPIAVVGFIVLGIYKLVELYAKRKERIMLIEKFSTLSEIPLLPNISFEKKKQTFTSLRVALLFIGIGLGCMLAFFTEYGLFNSFIENQSTGYILEHIIFVLYFSFISVFGGLGLLCAHLIESKQYKEKK